VVLWIETPTNPTLDVAVLERLCREAAARGVRTVVDSTFATPIGARPLASGATVVMHSGTKFIGGHSDLLIGLAVTNDVSVRDGLARARVVQGATPGALEAFLALRGLRTLPLRHAAASESAAVIAERLAGHRAVETVRQVGPMVSFVVAGGAVAADRVCAATRIIVEATSLGGVETTMERRQKYAGDAHVPPGLIRMSVGIEDVDDLWLDLERALES
jgi:cystathionine gamma-synthase